MSDVLRNTRKSIKNEGRFGGEKAGEAYQEQIQDIKRRMNAAKISAMKDAEKPFLAELKTIEEEYAMFLALSN